MIVLIEMWKVAVSEENHISNWAIGHFWDILAKKKKKWLLLIHVPRTQLRLN